MFGIKVQRDRDRRFVDRARLSCPLRGGDLEIEHCYACGRLVRLVDSDRPAVVCTVRGSSSDWASNISHDDDRPTWSAVRAATSFVRLNPL